MDVSGIQLDRADEMKTSWSYSSGGLYVGHMLAALFFT